MYAFLMVFFRIIRSTTLWRLRHRQQSARKPQIHTEYSVPGVRKPLLARRAISPTLRSLKLDIQAPIDRVGSANVCFELSRTG